MQTYTVTQSARIIGVSAASIRRWCNEFSAHISSMAAPGSGQERILTGDDLRVMAYVHDRLNLGASVRMVRDELPTASLPPLSAVVRESLLTASESDVPTSETALATLTTAQLRLADSLASLVELGTLRAEIDELRRRVDELTTLAQAAHDVAHTHREGFPYRAVYRAHDEKPA